MDDVWVNGEGPLRFMLDTGAMGAGRVDSSLVERLGLVATGSVQAGDGGGRRGPMMESYELESLQLGPLRAEGVRVLARDYNQFGAAARGRIDGILGIDLFEELLLTIDYAASVLRLERGELPEIDERETLALIPESPIPSVRVTLAGESYDAYIDTGAMGAVIVPSTLETSLPLDGEPRVVGQARTVSGAFEIRSTTLDASLGLGRHRVYRPELILAGAMNQVVLGSGFLSDYALTLDQRNERVRFWRASRPAPEAAPLQTHLSAASTRTPLTLVNGRPVIEASIGEHGPFRFVLDTGASMLLLNRDLAEELKLAEEGQSMTGAPGGAQTVPVAHHTLDTMSVGEAQFEAVSARSWDLPDIQNALGDVRGIIGLPLFYDLLVTLDVANEELVLAHDDLRADSEAVAYEIDASGLPSIEIDVAGHTIAAHFDTGNPGALSVPESFASELPLAGEPRVMGRGRTVSGEFEIRGATLDGQVNVAGARLERPTILFNSAFPTANVGSAVLLGSNPLSFDQRSQRVRLGDAIIATPKRRTYGLMLAPGADGVLELQGTVPDSVAESAGLVAGDRIVAIGGVALAELDAEARAAAFRAPRVELTVERGGERLEIQLELAPDEE